MKNCCFVLLLIILISSCRKKVDDFEYIKYDPKPTFISILSVGEKPWAQVSLANQLDDVHPTICDNAEVLFYKDGAFLEKLEFDDESQLYVGESIVESKHSYSCNIIIPNFDTIKASAYTPKKPAVIDFEVIDMGFIDDTGETQPSYLLTFATNPDSCLYYGAKLWGDLGHCNGFYSFNYKGEITSSYEADDPVLLNEGIEQLLFSNTLINDKEYTLKINGHFDSRNWSFGSPNDLIVKPVHGKIVVRMSGLSGELYNYLKSYYQHYEPDAYDNLFLGVITPTNYYSNVENGIGVFGAQACYVSDTIYYNMEH